MKWRCGGCGAKYTTEEYLKLEKGLAKKDDKIDEFTGIPKHGFIGICSCGYKFHNENWYIQV